MHRIDAQHPLNDQGREMTDRHVSIVFSAREEKPFAVVSWIGSDRVTSRGAATIREAIELSDEMLRHLAETAVIGAVAGEPV